MVLEMHRIFPDAPIYTSLYDPEATYPEFREADIRTSFLQRLPHSGNAFRAYLPLFPAAFRRMRVQGYDLVISSSAGWAHSVRTGNAFHLCYCYAPAKWLYRTDDYLGAHDAVPGPARPLLKPVLAALRRWDRNAARRPDLYVGISRYVADEVERIYKRQALVIYPPVSLGLFAPSAPSTKGSDGYYLVVARLLPYKRVDLAIKACMRRGARLVVVGEGPERDALMRLADESIEFRSRVDDGELTGIYAGANAVVQCGMEDFGLAPLEANASGRPVVAFEAGGALDTVIDGQTGVLFKHQTTDSLHEALDRLEAQKWDPDELRKHAASFSEERFADELRSTIDTAMGTSDPR